MGFFASFNKIVIFVSVYRNPNSGQRTEASTYRGNARKKYCSHQQVEYDIMIGQQIMDGRLEMAAPI